MSGQTQREHVEQELTAVFDFQLGGRWGGSREVVYCFEFLLPAVVDRVMQLLVVPELVEAKAKETI